jgi:hypothetical protein
MSSNFTALTKGTLTSLWTRAPLWRFCLSAAILFSVLGVCFPPVWRMVDVLPLPHVPEEVAYQPQQNEVVGDSEAVASAPSVAKAIPTMTAGASVPQTHKSTRPLTTGKSAATTADTNHMSRAPATAQISMAVSPTPAKTDSSGLDSAFLGRTYRQSIPVVGFTVPLPPGEWAMLSNSTIHLHGSSGMAYFLGRIEHKKLVGAIRLFAVLSTEQPGAGFPSVNGCVSGNPNLNYLSIDSITPGGHQGCWLINNYFTPPLRQWADRAVKIDALDRAAAGDLAAKGVTYQQDFVDVRFTRSETWGLLEVSYLFDPELNGVTANVALSARESDWHAPNVIHFPDKMTYLAKTREWGEDFWPKFLAAFISGKPP